METKKDLRKIEEDFIKCISCQKNKKEYYPNSNICGGCAYEMDKHIEKQE